MARTAHGLNLLLARYVLFIGNLDLSVNFSKSYVMVVGPKSTSSKAFKVANSTLGNVMPFPYLGVLFNTKNCW